MPNKDAQAAINTRKPEPATLTAGVFYVFDWIKTRHKVFLTLTMRSECNM